MIVRKKWIERDYVRANPDALFVFGDNMKRVGMGGQAGSMRGEPNAIGIPTKWWPDMSPGAFFRDDMPNESQVRIVVRTWMPEFENIEKALKAGKDVFVPFDGLGTGLSKMPELAPGLLGILNAFFEVMGERHGVRVED